MRNVEQSVFNVERHDEEDGSITYEIWDYSPESYRRLCKLNDDELSEHMNGKRDAELIVRALNALLRPPAGESEVRVKALEEQLAKFIPDYDPSWMDKCKDSDTLYLHRVGNTYGDLRRAHALLPLRSLLPQSGGEPK